MSLSDTDHAMIHHAKGRGLVVVTRQGRTIDAALISWRPRGNRTRARVQFIATDRQANVPCEEVSLP